MIHCVLVVVVFVVLVVVAINGFWIIVVIVVDVISVVVVVVVAAGQIRGRMSLKALSKRVILSRTTVAVAIRFVPGLFSLANLDSRDFPFDGSDLFFQVEEPECVALRGKTKDATVNQTISIIRTINIISIVSIINIIRRSRSISVIIIIRPGQNIRYPAISSNLQKKKKSLEPYPFNN